MSGDGFIPSAGGGKKAKKTPKNLFMCKLSFNFCAFQRLKCVTKTSICGKLIAAVRVVAFTANLGFCRKFQVWAAEQSGRREAGGGGGGAVTGIAPVSSSLTPPTLKLREPEAFQACSPALKLTGILIIIIMKLMEVEGGLDRRALGPGGGA